MTVAMTAALAACTGDKQTDFTARLAVACDSYASTLKVLAVKRDRRELTPKEIRTVNDIRGVVNPVCLPGSNVPDVRAAFLKISDGIAILIKMKGTRS